MMLSASATFAATSTPTPLAETSKTPRAMPTAARAIICLAGPTAAGKSAATLALAERWPIEIINVDSATIYRAMDIGTAKPSAAEQAAVPQHLLDIRDPAQAYSASEFCQDTFRLIDEIRARGRIPLLAGGTMMYYKALRDGLDDLPSADPQVRQTLEARAAIEGWPALHAELARVDPVTAARLAPQDSQRIQRALEIYALSGQPMSALLTRQRVPLESVQDRPARGKSGRDISVRDNPIRNTSLRDDSAPTATGHGFARTATPAATAADHEWFTISLEPSDRLALHARIAARFNAMLSAGLLDEVARLRTRPDLHLGLPAIRCVGYRQLWEHLDGLSTLAQAHEQAVAATRQLAKRQITWLRAQPERHVIDCLSPDAVNEIIQACAPLLDHEQKSL